ncbi:ribonuclease HII [uncultured Serinicoccus sp.]|uniref:ribonuclease HII n=1 Tax=uncultured Serinicoccus sp. TaxID=735514 RepID=UPI002619BFA7|nr:ribonuclease HII [uncultured Serinicoccus sp.]
MSTATPRRPTRRPSLRVERTLQREGYAVLVGMDEVGRGALAGPVSVGVVAVDASCRTAPQGVKDSKLLTAAVRERLVPRIRRWALAHAVGHAWPQEIDDLGIMAALRLAGERALAGLEATRPDLVLLDGNHDWLTDPQRVGLLGLLDGPPRPPVRTMVKADLRCSSVAAASVLAKVERDGLMVQASAEPRHTPYLWDQNKGYAAPEHQDALRRLGPSDWHRRSWNIAAAATAVAREEGVAP